MKKYIIIQTLFPLLLLGSQLMAQATSNDQNSAIPKDSSSTERITIPTSVIDEDLETKEGELNTDPTDTTFDRTIIKSIDSITSSKNYDQHSTTPSEQNKSKIITSQVAKETTDTTSISDENEHIVHTHSFFNRFVTNNNDSLKTTQEQETKSVQNSEEHGMPNFGGIITTRKIIWSIFFLFIGYLSVQIISFLLRRLGNRSVKYRITTKRIEPLIKISVWIFTIYFITEAIIKPPNAMVVAFFTSISVAVGFAAQDLLKNIFGGLMILFDRPFQMGDKIDVGSQYGEVTNIGLRSTRILTGDDSEITVPNSVMMNSAISNSNTGASNCQVVSEFYLPITTDTQKARQIAIEAAKVSRFVYLNKPVVVLFFNEAVHGKSIYKMRLKAYVSDLRYEFAFKSDITEITIREFIKEGIVVESKL